MPHSPPDMVRIIRDFAQELQIQVVTLDYEALIHLFVADALACHQLMGKFSGSQTKLQRVMNNLEARASSIAKCIPMMAASASAA